MKPKILFITLLLLGFVHLAQGSIPPNGLQASLVLSHGMPLESAGCTTGDESHVSLANEGVTNSGAGCRSIKVAIYINGKYKDQFKQIAIITPLQNLMAAGLYPPRKHIHTLIIHLWRPTKRIITGLVLLIFPGLCPTMVRSK